MAAMHKHKKGRYMANNNLSPLVILRRSQVENRTGLSRASIYLFMKNGSFPKAVALGQRSVGWHEAEIDEWIRNRQPKKIEGLSQGGNHA